MSKCSILFREGLIQKAVRGHRIRTTFCAKNLRSLPCIRYIYNSFFWNIQGTNNKLNKCRLTSTCFKRSLRYKYKVLYSCIWLLLFSDHLLDFWLKSMSYFLLFQIIQLPQTSMIFFMTVRTN